MLQRKSLMTLKLLLLSSFLFAAGCSTVDQIEVDTVVKNAPIPLQKQPKPVALNDIKIYVVTEENFSQFIEKLKTNVGTDVFYAITVKDYEKLSLNMEDIKRYIDQQKAIIIYYEDIIKKSHNENT